MSPSRYPAQTPRTRRSIRLRGYDYSQAGAYFITLCTKDRRTYFDDPKICEIAEDCWLEITNHAPEVQLDEWIVMPNHVHGIIVIDARRGVQLNAPTPNTPRDPTNPFSAMSPRRKTLSVIVRTYKAAVTTLCREISRANFAWQRNYYEYIIRNESGLTAIREYIRNNPLNWSHDVDNPENFSYRLPPKAIDDYLRDVGL